MKKRYVKTANIILNMLCCFGMMVFWGYKVLPIYSGYHRTQIYLSIPAILILFSNVFLLTKLVREREYKYERLFVMLSIIWGGIFTLIIPLAVGADGNSHLGTCYAMSNELLGYDEDDYIILNESGEREFEFGTFVRKEELKENELRGFSTQSYIIAAESGWFNATDDGKLYLREDGTYWDWGGTIRYRYPFSTLGMSLGRLLGMGQIGIIYLAKFFNILAYALIGYFCVRIIPIGKAQMVSIAMVPMVLETYSSLHYDNIMIELIMLFACLCLYYSYRDKDMRIGDILLLLLILVLLFPMKYVFTFNALLVLMIPLKKYNGILQNKKHLIGLASVIVCILVLGIYKYGRGIWGYILQPENAKDTYNVKYILQHPQDVLVIFIKSFSPTHIWNEINHMMGGWIGHLQFFINKWLLLMILIVIFVGVIICKGERLNRKNRIIAITTTVFVFFLAWVMLLGRVPIDSPKVGLFIFGRYLMAIFMMTPVWLGTNEKENNKMLYVYNIQSLLLTGVVCNILTEVITNYNIM